MSAIAVGLCGFVVLLALAHRTGPDHPSRGGRTPTMRHRDRI